MYRRLSGVKKMMASPICAGCVGNLPKTDTLRVDGVGGGGRWNRCGELRPARQPRALAHCLYSEPSVMVQGLGRAMLGCQLSAPRHAQAASERTLGLDSVLRVLRRAPSSSLPRLGTAPRKSGVLGSVHMLGLR